MSISDFNSSLNAQGQIYIFDEIDPRGKSVNISK